MKRYLLLILAFYGISYGQTHQNLIYNCGFETNGAGNKVTASNCVSQYANDNWNSCPTSNCVNPDSWSDMTDYWSDIYAWDCPDKKGHCCGVGSADIFCKPNSPARSYLRFGGGDNDEFIVQKLREDLTPGHIYYVELYTNIPSGNSGIGAVFHDGRPVQCHYWDMSGEKNPPDISIPTSNFTGAWEKTTFFYQADAVYNYFSYGSFDHGNWGGVDDIRIFDLGTDFCADNDWYFQNTDMYSFIYEAADEIVAGYEVTGYMEKGDVIIKSGEEVYFKAGNKVVLEPGFSTEPGSYFETIIEPCSGGNPCIHLAPPPQNYKICDLNPIQLGFPNLYGLNSPDVSFNWSPSSFLDDPTSSSPTFTPPGGNGEITYTVTMTSSCGGFIAGVIPGLENPVEVEVTVRYFDNPSPNPSVTLSNVETSEYEVSFDATLHNDAEQVTVSVLDQNGNYLFSQEYYTDDFGCCSFSWSTSQLPTFVWNTLTVCEDYEIIVSTSNWCYPQNVVSESVPWNKSNNGPPVLETFPNIITANGDGTNDCLLLEFSNTESYEIQVFGPNGNRVFHDINNVSQSVMCAWHGQCNQISTCSQPCVLNGTYYVIVDVFNCNGTNGQAQHVNLLYGTGDDCISGYSGMALNDHQNAGNVNSLNESIAPGESANISSDGESYEHNPDVFVVFPNPTNDILNVHLSNNEITMYQVMDINGRIILSGHKNTGNFQVDVSTLANGVYIVKGTNSFGEIYSSRFIKISE